MNAEQLEAKARDFSLASMLTAYPDAECEATFTSLLPTLAAHPGASAMGRWLAEQGMSFDALRSHYIELFDSGKHRVSLYETEYGRMRGAAKGNELADIAGFYGAFGFSLDSEGSHEMLDHLAVELEFHALMLAKCAYLEREGDSEGVAIVQDAMKKFLAHHLGAFVAAAAERGAVPGDAAYGQALRWVAGLVRGECERLGAAVKPLDYFADAELEKDAQCATNLPA